LVIYLICVAFSAISHPPVSVLRLYLFFSMLPRPPPSTLFPYTTLFRSSSTSTMFSPTRTLIEMDWTERTLAWLTPRTFFLAVERDRKSTRLNSSHLGISYAVFCLKKKKIPYACNGGIAYDSQRAIDARS